MEYLNYKPGSKLNGTFICTHKNCRHYIASLKKNYCKRWDNCGFGCFEGRPQKQRRVAKRATNKPIAEMGYVREAFKIAMANSIDNNYREMWRTRKNAVLWALRH